MSSEAVRHNLVPPHLSSILPSTTSARVLISHPPFPSSLLPHCSPWNDHPHPLGYKLPFLQEELHFLQEEAASPNKLAPSLGSDSLSTGSTPYWKDLSLPGISLAGFLYLFK